ncbi:Pectate lyase [Thalictrum thalictroides]|uniref:Pectate lyase n=1 Tax=Thalictrum thalictroides TaxID=46969 RepID=A0A7J6W8B1_THATH|nr:Pectate lyase [Thalictrum thalictroides]
MFCLLTFVCSTSSHDIGNERCDHLSELRNNITKRLYDIEKDLKMLMKEEGRFVGVEQFDQVHLILHEFLSSKYLNVEKRLNTSFVQPLWMYSASNLTSYAFIHGKQVQPMIQQLIQCNENITNGRGRLINLSRYVRNGCFADGTQCQYRPCAQGNRLPVCAVGFATGVTGGAAGRYYTVTRSDDNEAKYPAPGTLRYAVNIAEKIKGGVWIVFKESMIITLKEKLWLNSDTTIDGRDVNVTIVHRGLVLERVKNVILHNFEVVSTGDSDTVHVFDGTRLVWIDHLTSRDAYLGLVTVLQGSCRGKLLLTY